MERWNCRKKEGKVTGGRGHTELFRLWNVKGGNHTDLCSLKCMKFNFGKRGV